MLVDSIVRAPIGLGDEDLTTISDADTNDTETQAGSDKGDDSLTEIPVASSKVHGGSRKKYITPASTAPSSEVSTPAPSASPIGNTGATYNHSSNQVSTAESTVMIFDWDDTLLPTSFLARQGLRVDGPCAPPAIQAALDTYSQCVRATLIEARRQGTVFIVTNAETGWIELTVKKFMPLVAREVAQIRQLSARSAFEPQGISNPFQWKERAFQLVIEGHYARLPINTERHVVSFGDSSHEREAALRVCAAMGPKTRCKSLKFMERPDLEHLTKEHNLIRDCLAQIVSHAGPLDLCIQCQQTSNTSQASDTGV